MKYSNIKHYEDKTSTKKESTIHQYKGKRNVSHEEQTGRRNKQKINKRIAVLCKGRETRLLLLVFLNNIINTFLKLN